MLRGKLFLVSLAAFLFALVVFSGAEAMALTYSTSFPLAEDPISDENGNWINGGSCASAACVGLAWSNVETTPGHAFGLESGTDNYTDATALLAGTWSPNQTVQAKAFVKVGATYPGDFPEVEIRLLSSLSAYNCTGYEVNYSIGNGYMGIVRWNGGVGDFSYITATCTYGSLGGGNCNGSQYNVVDGDEVKATAVVTGGTVTISAYKNGKLMGTATDPTFTSGSPGMGFNYGQCSGTCQGSQSAYGFTSYTASDEAAGAPSAPRNVSATAGDGQATVTFLPPASYGGSPIAFYTVTYPGSTPVTVARSPITVTGLADGTLYMFTVTATNENGAIGPPASSNGVTPEPLPPPGAPTRVTATAGPGRATVSFSRPALNGGSAIKSYTVTPYSNGTAGQPFSGVGSPIAVTGLTNAIPYTFTVTATNGNGLTSLASSPSNSVTPAGPPDAPASVTASVTPPYNGEVQVSFTPAFDEGSAITYYAVTPYILEGSRQIALRPASGTSSPITVRGLKNGDTYVFTVKAINKIGYGQASGLSNSVIPSTVPGPPRAESIQRGDGEAAVYFVPPASDGGSAIMGYTVLVYDVSDRRPFGNGFSGTQSPILVSGLTDGTKYVFTVEASNANGPGPASRGVAVIPGQVPFPPTDVTATAGNAQATVTFIAPADKGPPITSYTVTSSPGGRIAHGTSSPITVNGLRNDTAYTFTVRASNAIGPGPSSSSSNSVTPAAPR